MRRHPEWLLWLTRIAVSILSATILLALDAPPWAAVAFGYFVAITVQPE